MGLKQVKGSRMGSALLKVLLVLWACAPIASATGERPLSASGVISTEEVRIASEFPGQVRHLLVHKGDTVQEGQVVAVLSNALLEGQVQQAEAALASAQASLALVASVPRDEARAAVEAQLRIAEAQAEGTRARLSNARRVLADPQELRGRLLAAETQLRVAKQNTDAAEAEYRRALYERDRADYGSPQRESLSHLVEAQKAALAAARAEADANTVAVDALQRMMAKPLSLEVQVRAAEADLRQAEAAARVARARLDELMAGARREDVTVAQARIEVSRAQLELAQAQLSRLTLRSPSAGIVLEQSAAVGETVLPATSLLIVANLREVNVTVFVPEPRLPEVYPGQQARVMIDSLPGREFEGRVVRIANRAEYTPRNVATQEGRQNTFYAVKVRVESSGVDLKPGMPVDVFFEKREGA